MYTVCNQQICHMFTHIKNFFVAHSINPYYTPLVIESTSSLGHHFISTLTINPHHSQVNGGTKNFILCPGMTNKL